MVCDGEAEVGVCGGFDVGVGPGERARDVAQAGEHGFHVVGGEPGGGLDAEQPLESVLVLDGLGYPLADLPGGVGLFAQDGAVGLDLGVELGDAVAHLLAAGDLVGVGLACGGEELGGVVEVLVVEQLSDPRIDLGEDRFFFEVDGARVLAAVDGVVAAYLAAVVGPAVVPAAFHPPATRTAAHEADEDVLAALDRAVRADAALVRREDRLHGIPLLLGDECLVGLVFGADPVGGVVPAHPGLVAEGDVVDVDEHLVAALLVPDLVSEISLVAEDDADCGVVPGDTVLGAVPVTDRILGAGAEDAFGGEHKGDGPQALASDELGEDPLHYRSCERVGFEAVEALAVGGLALVGVRAGVGEAVAVGRAATLEAALDGDLGFHRGADAGLDAVAFALAHAAVERHDDLVGVAARIDGAADLGHPELYAVVDEDRKGEAELVAVERSLRLADHYSIETTVGIDERLQQSVRLGAARPWQ